MDALSGCHDSKLRLYPWGQYTLCKGITKKIVFARVCRHTEWTPWMTIAELRARLRLDLALSWVAANNQAHTSPSVCRICVCVSWLYLWVAVGRNFSIFFPFFVFFFFVLFALGCDRDAYNLHVLLICDSRLAGCGRKRKKIKRIKARYSVCKKLEYSGYTS